MNECIFLFHTIAITCFLLTSLYLGRVALSAFVAISWLFANFFVTKEILFFGFEVTASDVYTIGGMLALSCLQEYFGKDAATFALKLSFVLLLFAGLASLFHIGYIPSPHDSMHAHFAEVLKAAPRLIGASFVSFFVSQYFEIRLFSVLQKTAFPFWMRAYVTSFCSQIIDTLLFSFIGLYGVVHAIWDVVLMSIGMKCLILSITAPFLVFSKRFTVRDTHAI